MLLATALTTLALIGGADAARIRWRHAGDGDSRRWVVSCNGAPYGPAKIGTPFALAHDYAKYCSVDWKLTMDKVGQISTGGDYGSKKFCMDATSGEFPVSVSPSSVRVTRGRWRQLKTTRTPLTPDPANGATPHLWDCYDGLDVQQWVFHSDGHIELGCTGLCLDVKDGYNGDDIGRRSVLQLWDCIPGNRNQEFDYVTQYP